MGRFKDISMQMEPYDQEWTAAHADATQARLSYYDAKRVLLVLKAEMREAERLEKEAYDKQEDAYDYLINGFTLDGK